MKPVASADAIASAFVDACLLDVTALKPGNVGLHAGGHGMEPLDFVRSAEAAAPAIVASVASVGERIHRAVAATQQAVGANTNLGIVLLAAPVVHAAVQRRLPSATDVLSERLNEVLGSLTVADAERAFAAIRLARPGGLGSAVRHDVHAPAQARLREAMREAADRDMIARQYADGYAEVIETGLGHLAVARARGRDWRWTTTEVYLAFLSRYPDSHIARKFGAEQATILRDEAIEYARAVARAPDPTALSEPLLKWDSDLKARGLNPGTSADLAVASLFLQFLRAPHAEDYPHRGERRDAGEEVGIFPTG